MLTTKLHSSSVTLSPSDSDTLHHPSLFLTILITKTKEKEKEKKILFIEFQPISGKAIDNLNIVRPSEKLYYELHVAKNYSSRCLGNRLDARLYISSPHITQELSRKLFQKSLNHRYTTTCPQQLKTYNSASNYLEKLKATFSYKTRICSISELASLVSTISSVCRLGIYLQRIGTFVDLRCIRVV